MNVRSLTVLLCVGAIPLSGCGGSPTERATEEFKAFAARLDDQLPATINSTGGRRKQVTSPVKYDIRRTNSVVSPLEAELTFSYEETVVDKGTKYLWTRTVTAAYLLNEQTWVCKAIDILTDDVRHVSGRRELTDSISRVFVGRPLTVYIEGGSPMEEEALVNLLTSPTSE